MGCKLTKANISNKEMPDIEINVAESLVQKIGRSCGAMQIIFIFGGPGSRKGRIVNALVQEYEFYPINAEKLILNHLNDSIQVSEKCRIEGDHIETQKIQQYLKEHPEVLSLESVLAIVASELKTASENQQKWCLIDFVPNLRSILQLQTFVKDCKREMQHFEAEWPCAFAMNLDNVNGGNFNKSVAKNLTALKRSGQSDERDVTKTKKRYEEYLVNVTQFLKYFESSDRLVTIDVSCGIFDLVWAKISDFFNAIGFAPKHAFDSIVVFIFKPEDKLAVNLIKKKMEVINVASLSKKKDPTVEDLFICINEWIVKSDASLKSFMVNLEGVTGFDELELKENRDLLFLNMNSKQFCKYNTDQRERNFSDLPFTAICSNQTDLGICLFPREIPTRTCKHLTMLYNQTKTAVRTNLSKTNSV